MRLEPGNETKERMTRTFPRVKMGHTALQVPLSKLLNCFLLYKHHRVCVTIVDYYRHKVRLKHGVKSCAHPVHTSHQETVW